MTVRTFLVLLVAVPLSSAQTASRVPTIDDLLSLRTVSGTQIDPEGRRVAYVVTEADFKQDAFVTQVWIGDSFRNETYQLTRGDKSATNPQWSPDGRWVTFLSDRIDGKNQIFAISPAGGEAVALTRAETSINDHAWSPDGRSIAFSAVESASAETRQRTEHYGAFEVVRREYNHTHLWTIDVAEALRQPQAGRQRTAGRDFSVNAFAWSPDSGRIAFSATMNPDLIQGGTSDVYMLALTDNAVRKIVSQPGLDRGPQWSPDGKQIAFASVMGNANHFALNTRIAVVAADGGQPRSVTDQFDENASPLAWKADGIYFSGMQMTASHLFRTSSDTGKVQRLTSPEDLIGGSFSLSANGRRVALTAQSPVSLAEVQISDLPDFAPRQLTEMTDQAKGFRLGAREIISWKSQDGTVIEGVLIKPADFAPGRKYPLLCVIHGGPTGIDRPGLLAGDTRYYPADLWVARGALVLKVNYRGSAGYGEKFRRLNYRNLGVGDAWDVLSGIDQLIKEGSVDPSKVACMGWSQGGYISAFLTASSNRFAAISVGAGISNWSTYYYNTDITPFTINYLGDDPADDPAIYQKTSPMSYIKSAKTPTLIQHGELDRRVPIPNAYELRQGLEDRGVPVEMIVYKGFGHGITKPKAMRAVMEHNLSWFNHHLWGDPLPDYTKAGTAK